MLCMMPRPSSADSVVRRGGESTGEHAGRDRCDARGQGVAFEGVLRRLEKADAELNAAHVPGIWFPWGVGISLSECACVAFDALLSYCSCAASRNGASCRRSDDAFRPEHEPAGHSARIGTL
jgi:hypothetical protein